MSKNTFHKDFRLNGKIFQNSEQLIMYAKLFSEKLYTFLCEWFNDKDVVEVTTSGSTGVPKVIMLQKKYMKNSAKATGEFFKIYERSEVLCCLPLDFIAGKMMVIRALTLGWHLDLVEPSSFPLKNSNKPYDFSAMVPLQVANSLKKLDLINVLIVGGGDVSETLQNQLQQIKTKAYATYGMTETITHIAVKKLNKVFDEKKDSHYQILPNIVISKDQRNCLVIDAPNISDETIITNDVVELLSEKEFVWKGRFDNVINSGGIKLHPEEIEKKLAPLISQRYFVAGLPDKVFGEKLVLIVEGTPQKNIISKIKQANILTTYKIPKEVYFLDQFIETETGKIKRTNIISSIGSL